MKKTLDKEATINRNEKKKWTIENPKIPNEHSYKEIANYLIEVHRLTMNYYSVVMGIGLLGITITMGMFLYCSFTGQINKENCYTITVKVIPTLIFPVITTMFAIFEREAKKKDLYEKMRQIAVENNKNSEQDTIIEEYKKWTWSEFQAQMNATTQELPLKNKE